MFKASTEDGGGSLPQLVRVWKYRGHPVAWNLVARLSHLADGSAKWFFSPVFAVVTESEGDKFSLYPRTNLY